MAVAQRLHLRLFLEGVEVPVISAVVQAQPNAPAACTLQIPANDLALQLKPRTLVHLYFYDFYRGAPPSDRAWVAGENIAVSYTERDPELEGIIPPERFESSSDQQEVDLENQNYRLLFGGEVVGVNVEKTPMSRGITLQCMDWSMYWDYAFQYQVSAYSLGGGGYKAAFTGASTNLFNSFLEGNADIIMGLMETAPRNYPLLKGTLLGAITHIIEAIGGVNFGSRSIRGINDFFSIAELRLKLTQMLGANPFDQEAERRLMRANGFGSLFKRSLAGLGKQVSIRDVLNALQRYIFHEVIPITSPRYIPPLVDPNRPTYQTTSITANTKYDPVVRAATRLQQRAISIRTRQEQSTTPELAKKLSRQNGGLRNELTRLSNLCAQTARVARNIKLAEGSGLVGDLYIGVLDIDSILTINASRFQRLQNATRRGQRVDITTNTFYPPGTPAATEVQSLCAQIEEDMASILGAQIRSRASMGNGQPDPPARLITQIYRPDVWMVAPPRCNVVFPELYNSFNYGRSFMDEVSRVLLRTHSAFFGSDILFDGFYMAPRRMKGARTGRAIGTGRTNLEPPDVADAPAWFVRDLMDHELYTGIIPKFERMSDLNLHALRGTSGGAVELDPGDGGPKVRVGYAELAVNHIFYKYRFMSRQLNCQGKFNPFFVLGFPALIIDKYNAEPKSLADDWVRLEVGNQIAERAREGEGVAIDSTVPAEFARQREMEVARRQELTDALGAEFPSAHYLGTPQAVTHSVSADTGGSTAIQMAYARSTDEASEFMGEDKRGPSRYNRVRNITTTTTVAMTRLPQIDTKGPRGGNILSVEDVTQEFLRDNPVRPARGRRRTSAVGATRYRSSKKLPIFIPNARSGRRRGTQVVIGVPIPASTIPEAVALAGTVGNVVAANPTVVGTGNDGDAADIVSVNITFLAVKIREEVGVYRRNTVDLAAEDLVFPPWYSESYRSKNIGALYSYFFGTGSIVDPVNVVSPAGPLGNLADGGDLSGAGAATPSGAGPGGSTALGPTTEEVTTPDEPTPADVTEGRPEVIGPPGSEAETQTLSAATADAGEGTVTVNGKRYNLLGAPTEHGNVDEAVRALVDNYSLVRRNRFDVDDFLRSYTWRPIASIVDIFGTANLEIDDDGEVVRGVEGFHSRAFGDFDDLRQLTRTVDGQRVRTVLGMTTTDADEADGAAADRALRDTQRAARLDTRKEKRLAVYRYLQALLTTRGILG